MTAPYPRIPYSEADIRRIRLRGWLYVDKTRFLRRHACRPSRHNPHGVARPPELD